MSAIMRFLQRVFTSSVGVLGYILQSGVAWAEIAQIDTNQEPESMTQEEFTDFGTVDVTTQGMEQLTSVSQLSDVQLTDWAFQALQSLIERYGCLAGYPDQTFPGHQALSPYEFAAGLNACLNQIEQLIASNAQNSVTQEDLATLARLQEEFATELATLRGHSFRGSQSSMPSYATVGNWLFLFGSLLFTFDAINNAWSSCSKRSFLILTACCLFTLGCILFLLNGSAKIDSQH